MLTNISFSRIRGLTSSRSYMVSLSGRRNIFFMSCIDSVPFCCLGDCHSSMILSSDEEYFDCSILNIYQITGIWLC